MLTATEWAEYAQKYDTTVGNLLPYQDMLAQIQHALPQLSCDARIVDLGCGTGNLSQLLTQAGYTVTGIDGIQQMIERAAAKCAATFLDPHNLNNGIPCPNASEDAAVSCNVLYALKDPAAHIAEVARIIKPGSTFVCSTPGPNFQKGLILKAHAEACGMTVNQPDAFWLNIDGHIDREDACAAAAVSDPDMRDDMQWLTRFNARIVQSADYHFLSEAELRALFSDPIWQSVQIEATYAAQNWLVTATKGGSS